MQESANLFYEAGTLMLVGMAFVYAFLSLLIIVIKTVIAPLGRRYPDPIAKPKTPAVNNSSSENSNAVSDQPNQSIVAAITAAINQYRKTN